jgi:hypothetical protein
MTGHYHQTADSIGKFSEGRYSRKRDILEPHRKTGNVKRGSFDDFLKGFPFSTLNVYGDRIISGTRIC